MREVVVISTQSNGLNRVQTDASNYGQLQESLAEAGISVTGMKATVKGQDVELSSKSASIPSGAFTLFLSPSKVKSGK